MEASKRLSLGLIVLAGVAAYANSLHAPFVFDDASAITANASIHHLASAFRPAALGTTAGRPLLNLSFALNYLLGGVNPLGYHLVNLAIHVLAAVTLFGLVRRLTRRSTLALVVALLWTVHPLQTEAVTYVSQRAESLMGLFYLLTLYCLVRGNLVLSVVACFCGMATKETMVTAPVVAFLLDRAFLGGPNRAGRGYYAALASSWLLLGLLILEGRTGLKANLGFHQGVSAWTYLCTEGEVIVRYLKLAIWPAPLVFDYDPASLWTTSIVAAGVILAALGVTLVAWRRSPKLGFVAAAFFILLAPTSSFVPIATCPMAESRMYLPLAAVIVLVALALRRSLPIVGGAAALVLLGVTVRRNTAYASPVTLWRDTLAKQPSSGRAHLNLGVELTRIPGGNPEATEEFRSALQVDPGSAPAHYGLANELAKDPAQVEAALAEYRRSLALDPAFADAHVNLGNLYTQVPDRSADAISEYTEALRLNPDSLEAHFNLGVMLAAIPGREPEAIRHFEAALRIKPDFLPAEQDLAALRRRG